ncbi:MAG: hypothetical protein LBK22_00435, partial [Tannerella sp.]|nr:hypothetical protein [Tannerella sp.]
FLCRKNKLSGNKRLNLFLRCCYTSPGMILRIACQGIHLFSVDMHPLTGNKRLAVPVFLLIWFP